MSSKNAEALTRRKVWAEAKTAAHDYARNPCAATVRKVETAVDHIRHLNEEERTPQPKAARPQG